MIVIDPSYEIQDDLDQGSLVKRLEACGRICYKSEEKISEGSALPFVKKIAEHGHNSVMEMAVVTLRLQCSSQQIADFLRCQPKFFVVDLVENGLLVTGSIRAFRELYLSFPEIALAQAMVDFLGASHSYLLEGVWQPLTRQGVLSIAVEKMTLEQVEQLEPFLLLRHRFLSVKFIVNRAVTHEIVRHRPCSFLQESQRYCRYSQDKFGNQVTFIRPLFFVPDSAEYKLWQQAMELTEDLYLQLLETSTPQAARTVLPNSCKTEIIVYCNLAEWKHIFRLRTSPAAEPSMREVMIPLAAEMEKRYPELFI
ncbi:MAG: FAD-dependent thymidylate synthase [Proteobacteria bacterium]|nr:FAD-dependent thymidylate synthase [Pseudomonadota bacterium]MBU1649201.1 FAD-dependent thymidylate synthase [Pseudomonadota bacterium]